MLMHTITVSKLLGIVYMHYKNECKKINIFLFKKKKTMSQNLPLSALVM